MIEETKKKRKRDDGDSGSGKKEDGAAKRVKAEGELISIICLKSSGIIFTRHYFISVVL